MSKKQDFDLDGEVKRLSRKTEIDMKKSEYSFDNRMKRLDKDINKIMNEKIKVFDDNKKLTSDYLEIDYKNDTINRYREKLKKI